MIGAADFGNPFSMGSSTVLREVVKSYACVVLWMSVSISVILFNKWLLAFSGFPFPLALTAWHMLFCSVVGIFCIRILKVCPTHNMSPNDYIQRVLPIGMLYAGSLWLSNSSYLYLSVSFIQMTKSLMPGLVFASGVFLGTERFSRPAAANMGLIAFGVLVCALGETNLVVKGLMHQLAALVFEAVRLTMIQVLINSQGFNMNPLQSLYYVSPACFTCLLVPFSLIELKPLMAMSTWNVYPSVFLANAFLAFALNLAVFLLIGKTSALTMNIAGVIKDWLLIFFSFAVFKAPVTLVNLIGYLFCCSGVAIYNYMKLQMIKKKVAEEEGIQEELLPSSQKGLYHDNTMQQTGQTESIPMNSQEEILYKLKRMRSEMALLEKQVEYATLQCGKESV